MGKIAFVFAGQGAQHPGMGQELAEISPAAAEVFQKLDALRPGTSAQCFSGTDEELKETKNTQPCMFAVELAAAAALTEAGIKADKAAGFSLGEIGALTYTGAVDLETGFHLVCRRGELMQAAADETDGCMAAVLGLSDPVVEQICAETDGIVLPVNYNCEGQLVIAGTKDAVARAVDSCKQAGARRAVPLAVSGAFHTPLMAQAAAQLRTFAESLTVHEPTIPVYSNTDAQILSIENLPAHLEQHMVSPVRWKELVQNMMADGHTAALEIGPGKTLTGFARRISKQLTCTPVESNESVLAVTQAAE